MRSEVLGSVTGSPVKTPAVIGYAQSVGLTVEMLGSSSVGISVAHSAAR